MGSSRAAGSSAMVRAKRTRGSNGDEYAYGVPAQEVVVQQPAPGPSRMPMEQGAQYSRGSGVSDEDDAEDDDDDGFDWEGHHDAHDGSADEHVPDNDDDDDDDDDSADESADDNDYPAAPDVDALRYADASAHPPALAALAPDPTTALQAPALVPAPPHQPQSRHRPGGMHRLQELGQFGSYADADDDDVQYGDDEIARLVAAIKDDEAIPTRTGTRSAQAQGSSADNVVTAGPSHRESEPRPRVRHWDEAMIQERDEFEDELRGAHGMKRKKGRRMRNAPRLQQLSAEVSDLLSEANSDYVMGNLDGAIAALHKIISIEPYARAAWTLLMICFREKGEHAQAVQAGIILASLSSASTAVEMFKELAASSIQLGARQQAVYCLKQAIVRSGKTDTDAMWDHAVILEQLNDDINAAQSYAMVVERRPWDEEAKGAAVRIFHSLQEYRRGAEVLDTVRKWMMKRFPNPCRDERTDVDPAELGDAPDPVQMEAARAAASLRAAAEGDPMQVDEPRGADALPQTESEVTTNSYSERDLYSHVEFLLYAREPFQAISVLRETVRWLQGRADETYWDDVEYDDREFDEVRPQHGPGGSIDFSGGQGDAELGGDGRRAFDRRQDLLAAGRRRRRHGKGAGRRDAGGAGGRSRDHHAHADDEAGDEEEEDQEDAGADGESDTDGDDADQRRRDAEAAAEAAEDIELQARRRQWEAWESRAPVFGLAPSLRVLLGRARLMVGDEDEAERQFSIVLEHDVTVYSDLFADVAQAYMEYGYWQQAFDVLTEMDRVEGLRTAQYYEWLGTCCQNLGQLQQAVKYLEGVVAARPQDASVRYQLAEIYAELGDNDSALQLAASLVELNKSVTRSAAAAGEEEEAAEPSTSFFSLNDAIRETRSTGTRRSRRSQPSKPSGPTTREKLEAVRELEYSATMARLSELESVLFEGEWWRPDVDFEVHAEDVERGGEPSAASPMSSWAAFKLEYREMRAAASSSSTSSSSTNRRRRAARVSAAQRSEREQGRRRAEACKQWLDAATNLIEGFKHRKGMFKKDAKAPLLSRGFGRRGRGRGSNIYTRATALLSRLQERMVEAADGQTDAEQHGLPEFRGIHFDEWAVLFMKYAVILTKVGEYETALDHLKLVSSSYTMAMHDRRRLMLMLTTISCAVYARDFVTVYLELRALMNVYTFHDEWYRLGCGLSNVGGIYGLGGFMNSTNLKAFLRRIRHWTAIANGHPHSMRSGKWVIHGHFAKPRHLSNFENRSLLKRVPLGFADRLDELVGDGHGQLANKAGQGNREEGGGEQDEDMVDVSPDADARRGAPARHVEVPIYDSLADIPADRLGWQDGRSAQKVVTLQDVLRNGYPSRPSVVAETFYSILMLLSKSNLPALFFLTKQYARLQTDPLLTLLCAVAFLARALNRQVDNRHQAILQAFAYLSRYRALCGLERRGEVEYTFGRAFHQIGLLQQAVYHYERVLALADADGVIASDGTTSTPTPAQGQTGKGFTMTHEAAYNLALIYSAGGSPALARRLYERWLSL